MSDAAARLFCKNKRTFCGLEMFPNSNPSKKRSLPKTATAKKTLPAKKNK